MLAFRKISRTRGLSLWTPRICFAKSDIRECLENGITEIIGNQERPFYTFSSTRLYRSIFGCSSSYAKACSLSSQAGAQSGGDEDDDSEASHGLAEKSTSEDEKDDVSEDLLHELGAIDDGGKSASKRWVTCAMAKAVLAAPARSVSSALEKWVEEGNEVTQLEASLTMVDLRRRRMFARALQLSEWLESRKYLEFTGSNYASRVDLIAKVSGIAKAEEYMKHIPESFKCEVYHTLLASCVVVKNLKKSEEVFHKMRELITPITCSACNQMLILYRRSNKRKIAGILQLMHKEKVQPSLSTYKILIDSKGQSNDINGMERIVETMKSEGLEPNIEIQASLARYYAAAGLKDRAEELLKEIEGGDLNEHRWDCCWLLPVYASLGREDEVERLWKLCESEPRLKECLAAIEAWGQLKKVENAEAAFEIALSKAKKPSPRHISALLKVYAKHKMLEKGKDLMKRMADIDGKIGPLELDGLVELFIAAGEVKMAGSEIEKAAKEKHGRPLFHTFMLTMGEFAKRGDIHNTEKMFLLLKHAGYPSGVRHYQLLLDAYTIAKVPVYGITDRMRADNVFPNRFIADLLAKADPLRRSSVSDLLE